MRALLTIHGVGFLGGRGQWQEAIQWVIAPHFDHRPIKYSHYRWLGLMCAVVEPWALVMGTFVYVLGAINSVRNLLSRLLIIVLFVTLSLGTPPIPRLFAALR